MVFLLKELLAGYLSFIRKDYSKAILIYKGIIKKKNKVNVHGAIAYCYYMNGNFDMAEKHCKCALNIDEGYTFALKLLSVVYKGANQDDLANQYYEKALNTVRNMKIKKSPAVDIVRTLFEEFLSEPIEDEWLKIFNNKSNSSDS